MSLLIVGTVAFDSIETPLDKREKILGGAATYIGLASCFFSVNSSIVSVVGKDFPKAYLMLLKNKNIDVSAIEINQKENTFFWRGRYLEDINKRETLETELNALAHFRPLLQSKHKRPSVLMLGNLHPEVQLGVLEQLEQRPHLIVLDTMNYWMEHTSQALSKIIKQVDVLTINDEEALQLAQTTTIDQAASKILKMGIKYLIIKKGPKGALLFDAVNTYHAPGFAVEKVLDPTGAGDVFAGAFTGHLTKTNDFSFENLKQALLYGCVFASFSVEAFGIERLLNLSQAEIETRLNQLKKASKS